MAVRRRSSSAAVAPVELFLTARDRFLAVFLAVFFRVAFFLALGFLMRVAAPRRSPPDVCASSLVRGIPCYESARSDEAVRLMQLGNRRPPPPGPRGGGGLRRRQEARSARQSQRRSSSHPTVRLLLTGNTAEPVISWALQLAGAHAPPFAGANPNRPTWQQRKTRAPAYLGPGTLSLRFGCARTQRPKPRRIAGISRAVPGCAREVSATRRLNGGGGSLVRTRLWGSIP